MHADFGPFDLSFPSPVFSFLILSFSFSASSLDSMDSLTAHFSGCLKMRRKRRRYQRLKHGVGAKKRVRILGFQGGGRRQWKMRLMPKLRIFRIISPMKVLERLRDAYMEMMLCLAGNVAQLNNGNVFLATRTHRAPEIPPF